MIHAIIDLTLIIVIVINIVNTNKENKINEALTRAHEGNRKALIELKDTLIKYIDSYEG